jgi:hypothetical protein
LHYLSWGETDKTTERTARQKRTRESGAPPAAREVLERIQKSMEAIREQRARTTITRDSGSDRPYDHP